MLSLKRREMLRVGLASAAVPSALFVLGCKPNQTTTSSVDESPSISEPSEDAKISKEESEGSSMQIRYLEIVTPKVDEVCKTYAEIHDVTFAEADPSLGGARTAKLSDGGVIGVRGPMRETETPVVRPYLFVDDIKAAVAEAEKQGAEIAIAPMEIPGQGTFAIFIQGGIESGLWQR